MQTLSIQDKQQALTRFDEVLWGHVGYYISNLMRSFFLGLTRAKFSASPFQDFTKSYYQRINHLSAGLAFLSDTAMILSVEN